MVVDGAGAGVVVVLGAGAVVGSDGAVVTVVDASRVACGSEDPQPARTARARRMATARPHERPTGHYLTKW
jgi:hypothetical protein